jgi:hypothetical protein
MVDGLAFLAEDIYQYVARLTLDMTWNNISGQIYLR